MFKFCLESLYRGIAFRTEDNEAKGIINVFSFILFNELYWLATSGGRVPVVAVCVLHKQLRICCATDSAIL